MINVEKGPDFQFTKDYILPLWESFEVSFVKNLEKIAYNSPNCICFACELQSLTGWLAVL